MPLFKSKKDEGRPRTDEEMIESFERELNNMLKKNYDLLDNQKDYPDKAYLLRPENLFAASFEKIDNNSIRINIEYKSNWSGYVTDDVRMRYERIIKGSLICGEVKSVRGLLFSSKSKIKIPGYSSYKRIIFTMQNHKTIAIKCKKIFIESIDIFVQEDNKLIKDEEFREIFRKSLMKEQFYAELNQNFHNRAN